MLPSRDDFNYYRVTPPNFPCQVLTWTDSGVPAPLIQNSSQPASFRAGVNSSHIPHISHKKLKWIRSPIRRNSHKRHPTKQSYHPSIVPTVMQLYFITLLSTYYFATPHRHCPIICLLEANLIHQLLISQYPHHSSFSEVLQAIRNKIEHAITGDTTTIYLEDLIPHNPQNIISLANHLEPPPIPKQTFLALKPPKPSTAPTSLPLLNPRKKPSSRTGARKAIRTISGDKVYKKPRLLLKSTGLRPSATKARDGYSQGAIPPSRNSINNSFRNSFREPISKPTPPPRGAPGASAIEECPGTPLGIGTSGRRLRRRLFRVWRRSPGVRIRLGPLGKGLVKRRVPQNAAARRTAGTTTAEIFKQILAQETPNPTKHPPQPYTIGYSKKLRVGTQNVQGMAEILKHQQVITMMRQQTLDILVLTETRGKSYYTYNSEGYLFIVSGSVQDPYAGVTIVVAPRLRPYIQDVTQHSPRLSSVTIAAKSGSMHILGVYAPHNKMDVDLLKIPFWDQLEDAFSKIPLPEPAYVLGDFNVRLQGRSSTEKEFLGPHILGKGMEFAQRKLRDNRCLFLDFLKGQESVDTITFKTPDLTRHVTYRDKTPPPQDWGAFILDSLGWIQTYDLIQHASQSDSRAIQIAHNIRQFLTATPIQQPPPAPPSADPLRFQNLDKCVTRRKWLPTVHSVKAVHSTGFPSDHYLLKVEIQVKLGSKIPTPTKPPHRTYTKNSDYAKEFRKFHAKPATPQGNTTHGPVLDVYTDGSGTAGKCSKSTPAGWGYVV